MAEFFKIKIFNYVESEINLNSFTNFPFMLFRIVFFNFQKLTGSKPMKKLLIHHAKRLYYKICLVIFAVGVCQIIFYTALHLGDFTVVINGVLNSTSILLVAFKALRPFWCMDEILNILEELKIIFERRRNDNIKYKVKSYLEGYHRFVKVYGVMFIFAVLGLFQPIISYLLSGSMRIDVNYWFPFDPFTSFAFPFVLFWASFIGFNSIILMLASDSLLYALITMIAMEFDILKLDFNEMNIKSKNERDATIVKLIERHCKLIELSDKLENIYSTICFACFVVTSVILCFITFQLSTTKVDLNILLFYVPYLGAMAWQVLLLCLFGQKLMDASFGIGDGIYESEWLDLDDSSYKRNIVLIILRAHRPKQLSAMGFAVVSVGSFTTVSN